jgi:hypothetical protein
VQRPIAPVSAPTPQIPAIVPSAATALAQPLGVEQSIASMQRRSPTDRYLLLLQMAVLDGKGLDFQP